MVHVIKETFNVHVYHKVIAVMLCQLVAKRYRLLCTAVWPEPIAMRIELRFTYRFHDLQYTLLNYPVYYGRDSKRSHLSIGFGYIDPLYRLWLIIPDFVPHLFHE